MSNYTMAQAKRDFERGLLVGFEVRFISSKTPYGTTEQGWILTLEASKTVEGYLGFLGDLVDARSKEERVFKTLDAAISAARQIGFIAGRLTYEIS